MNTIADTESGILERAITAGNASWSPEAARAILAFKLADADLRRADELAAKARSGAMTEEERQHLEDYPRLRSTTGREELLCPRRHLHHEPGLPLGIHRFKDGGDLV